MQSDSSALDKAPQGTPAVPTPSTPDDRSSAFRAVEGGNQMQSGERLLVEAYAAIWLMVFVFLVIMWRRERGVDQRIDRLEAALQKARDAAKKSEG